MFGSQSGLVDDATGPKPAYGLNSVALLVKLWGRCTHVETDLVGAQINFWLDDGSNLWDGTTNATGGKVLGVKVRVPTGYAGAPIATGSYYAVTGIMRTYTGVSGDCVRWLWPRDDSDIRLIP